MLPILFWVFYFLVLFFGGYYHRENFGVLGQFGIVWLLLGIIGLKVFGFNLN